MTVPPRLAAWSVHLYTALGAPLAMLAIEAISRDRYATAFWWMVLATFIDSTDGTLARRFRVKQVLPHFDGARLDDIVDYLNYVVVPLILAYHVALLPRSPWGLAIAAAPLLASAYGFCQLAAKTSDHFFTGFPSYWNIVVLYLYVFRWPQAVNVALLLGLSLFVFVPIRYLYPSRNPVARKTTYVLGVIWALMVVALVAQIPQPSVRLASLSLFFPAYYIGVSLWLHAGTPQQA